MRLIHFTMCAGLCVSAWASVSFYDHGAAKSFASAVEITTKGDRTVRPFNVGMPAISVEIAGQSSSAITVPDRDGSLIYQVDPANHMTIVAKHRDRTRPLAVTSHGATSQPVISLPLPDGCESAFSPYASPNRAHIIGRCIS
jgi:hypothetical protein